MPHPALSGGTSSSGRIARSQGSESSETVSEYLALDESDTLIDSEDSGDDRSVCTQSASRAVFQFQTENGRTYHGYRAAYPFPNDTIENDRLDSQFWLLHELFSERLHFAPLTDPVRILDIGTGTGLWAIEMGDAYPNARIEATDLSPIQPTCVPRNLSFLIDDSEQPDWGVPPEHYSYIHTRCMLGAFQSFPDVLARAFAHTAPGGWVESQELHFHPFPADGSMLPPDWPLREWSARIHDASMLADRPVRVGRGLRAWYTWAGFVDVQERVFELPIGGWRGVEGDAEGKIRGERWLANLVDGLQAYSMRYFTRDLGWKRTEAEVYLARVRASLKRVDAEGVKAFHKVYVVWGRKPGGEEA